jgi:PAS domain S-box-containing protein
VSERLLQDFAEIASDWFWEMDSELRFSFFSSRLQEFAGVEPDREIGKSRLEIAANSQNTAFWEPHIEDLLARRPFRNLVYPYNHKDGHVRWFGSAGSKSRHHFRAKKTTYYQVFSRNAPDGPVFVSALCPQKKKPGARPGSCSSER